MTYPQAWWWISCHQSWCVESQTMWRLFWGSVCSLSHRCWAPERWLPATTRCPSYSATYNAPISSVTPHSTVHLFYFHMPHQGSTHTDEKIVDTIHVQILGYLQVFHLSLISWHATMICIPDLDTVLPHLWCHLVLVNYTLRQQVLTCQHSWLIHCFIIVTILHE